VSPGEALTGKPAIEPTTPRHASSFTKLAVSLSDQHIPFQDKRIEKQTLSMLRNLQPDVIILNGDVVDFYSVSSFLKDPARKLTLQDELDQTKVYVAKVRAACPNADIRYTTGNHETRLTRYLLSNAKALSGLRCLNLGELLDLGGQEVKLHGTEGFRLNRNLIVTHGSRISRHAGSTARMEFDAHLMSGVSGHTHRVGRYDVSGAGGEYSWIEQGCLCQLEADYITGVPNWQNGLAIIEYSAHRFLTREVRIIDRKLILDGFDYSIKT
jgi:predicted phosphodiesterase